MKKIYSKLGEKNFRLLAAFFCLIGDLMLSKYLYDKFTDKPRFDEAFTRVMPILQRAFKQQGLEVPIGFQLEVFTILVNTLLTCLGLFLLFHLFNYTFFIFRKKFAQYYVVFLSWSGTVGALYMGLSSLFKLPFWGTLFVLQAILFFFVAYGIRQFPIPLVLNQSRN
jgi:hypothetical protein